MNEYFSDKMADAVIDGTRCYESSQSRDMCIHGICKVSRTFDIPLVISFKKCCNVILWKLLLCNRGLQAEQEIVIVKEIFSCLTKAQHAISPQNCLLWIQHTAVSREVCLLWTEALVWAQHLVWALYVFFFIVYSVINVIFKWHTLAVYTCIREHYLSDIVCLEFHFLIKALRLYTIKRCFFESTNMPKLLRNISAGNLKLFLHCNSSPQLSDVGSPVQSLNCSVHIFKTKIYCYN